MRSAFVTPTALPCSGAAFLRVGRCERFAPGVAVGVGKPCRSAVSTARFHARMSGIKETSEISTEHVGAQNSLAYRLYFKTKDGLCSPWHDIPLYPDPMDEQIVNFVNEIPKGTQAKMEIATDETATPIKQDVKKGELRIYKYGPSLVNYGAIPQTWEDPGSITPDLNAGGDNDPLDVTEIGDSVMPFGAVYPVKVLGCLALLDEGEVDWKIIAVNTEDPKASEMNNIADVQRVMPGKIEAVREWFKMYKTAEGKGENEYGYSGEAKDASFAMKIIAETNESYVKLKSGVIPNDDELWLK